jgi:hypothetical protein
MLVLRMGLGVCGVAVFQSVEELRERKEEATEGKYNGGRLSALGYKKWEQ